MADGQRQETRREGVRGGQPYFGLFAHGDFGGGTVQVEVGVQMQDGGMRWFGIPGTGLTSNGYLNFAASADAVAVAIRGCTTTPDVYWAIR